MTTHRVHRWAALSPRGLDFDPLLARLLAEEPVARVRLPHGDGWAWLVTRYADVKLATSDARFSRRALLGRPITRLAPHFIPLDEAVGFADPPEHTRLRRAAAKAFAPKSMQRLLPGLRRRMDELVDAMVRHGPPADLMEHVHRPLPLAAVSDLMGVPEGDRPKMTRWTAVLLSAGYGRARSERAKAEIGAYFDELLRRRDPDPDGDLAGILAAAVARRELSRDEAVGLAVLIQASGAHAVTNNSGNMLYALLTHPDQLARLRAEDADPPPAAIEELLRWIPHRNGVGMARIATADVRVGDVLIRAGDPVYASYLTANRDPAVFPDPHRLDLGRPAVPHLSFGHGPHHCVGAALARLESAVIVETLLRRLPGLRLAVPAERVRWQPDALIRGLETLPVTW